MAARDLRRWDRRDHEIREPRLRTTGRQLFRLADAVDQQKPARAKSLKHVHHVDHAGVDDHNGVRPRDRLVRTNRPVVDPTERGDRRTAALGAEAGKRLGVPAFREGSN